MVGAITGAPVIADSSPLIALERIGRLDLLAQVVGQIVIPPAVALEVGLAIAELPPIVEVELTRPIEPRIAAASLGAGETEVISLGLELDAQQLILDDEPAREFAMLLGLSVGGTLGLLRTAKDQGLATEVRPLVDALVANKFRLSQSLYRSFLELVGEAP